MEKLIEIQAELKAPKNQRNKFGNYNYRSCEDILEAVKPLLKKHRCTLTITDEIKMVGSLVFVEALAEINDGKTTIAVAAQAGINPDRKGMDIAQSFGSSSSYARKYALNGLFLIDDTKDSDATNDHGKSEKKPQPEDNKPWLNPKTKEWNNAVDHLKGEGTMQDIFDKYKVSKVNKEKLTEATLS